MSISESAAPLVRRIGHAIVVVGDLQHSVAPHEQIRGVNCTYDGGTDNNIPRAFFDVGDTTVVGQRTTAVGSADVAYADAVTRGHASVVAREDLPGDCVEGSPRL